MSTPKDNTPSSRVLVTGATGFLGGAVARSLHADGVRVLATGRSAERGALLEQAGLQFVAADLAEPEASRNLCYDVDTVVHCAALSSPWGPRSHFVRANVTATEVLVDACRTRGVRRLVHISTPSIYMGRRDREQICESDALPRPINHYAATKLRAEAVVGSSGIESVILRPRAIYGPGDTTIFPRLIRTMSSGRLPVIGRGDNRVDMTYVDNAVHAIRCAMAAPTAALGAAYNITDGSPVLLWDVVRRVADELDLSPPRGQLPLPVARLLAGFLELGHSLFRPSVEPRITRYAMEVLGRTMTLNIDRARDALGYEPRVGFNEGLEAFLTSWRAQSP